MAYYTDLTITERWAVVTAVAVGVLILLPLLGWA